MAFFKFRKAAGETAAPAPAPESVEAMRKRARYRLAGAALLVLAGVIGFPLLFDNQPRPIAVDIPIEIPDKAKVKPLVATESKASEPVATAPPAPAPEKAQVVMASPAASEARAPEKEEVIIAASKPAPAKVEDKPATKAEPKPEPKPESKVEAKPKAEAKPADKPKDKNEVTGRFVVQFGAFTDSARAHEARLKVEKLGMKTYAQIAETAEGKKFRVRVGPFEKRSDAEKAAEKIKKLDLPAAILGL